MFIIGCHLSTEGGYRSMGERILSVGGKSFQYFTKNPKGGKQNKPADPDDVAALLALIRENGLEMPLAHAPYTYNPCSKDEGVRNYSRDSMKGNWNFWKHCRDRCTIFTQDAMWDKARNAGWISLPECWIRFSGRV